MSPSITKALSILLPLALASLARAATVCPDGQYGVGLMQLCNFPTSPYDGTCDALTGEVWANDCNINAQSNSGYCNGGFSNGYTVTCETMGANSGVVTSVTDSSGTVYGTCTRTDGNCGELPEGYTSLAYCCAI